MGLASFVRKLKSALLWFAVVTDGVLPDSFNSHAGQDGRKGFFEATVFQSKASALILLALVP